MRSLVALLALLAVAAAAPQYLWPYGAYVVKDAANYDAVKMMRGLVPVPVPDGYYYVPVPVQVQTPVASGRSMKPLHDDTLVVPIADQDTNRGLVPTVEDTIEVKEAKALFKIQYEKAAIAAALTPERRRRDLSSVETPHHADTVVPQRQDRQHPVPFLLSAEGYWPRGYYRAPLYHPAPTQHAPIFY